MNIPPFLRRMAVHPATAAVLLFAATLALFWPAVSFSVLSFDDGAFITHNPIVFNGWAWSSVPDAFLHLHGDKCMYTPILWLSYLSDTLFFGAAYDHPWGFHFTNILLHALSAVVLFCILKKATRRTGVALFAAAFWALHPLRVESVAWLSERKDTLSTLFALLSTWFYLESFRQGDLGTPSPSVSAPASGPRPPGTLSPLFSFLAFFFFLLGILSKPMLVTLPFFFLLLDIWPLQRLSPANPLRGLPRLLLQKTHFFALTLVFSVVTRILQTGAIAQNPLLHRLSWLPVNYFFYLSKTLVPVRLTPLFLGLAVPSWATPWVALLLGFLAVAVWGARARLPGVFVGLAAFAGLLFPVSGIVTIGSCLVADRYSYLPAVGISLALAWTLARWPLAARLRRGLLSVLAIVALVPYAAATARLLPAWRNDNAFYGHVSSIFPHHFSVLNHDFFVAYFTEGDIPKAAGLSEELVEERPWSAYSVCNRTLVLSQTDSAQAAFDYLENAHPTEAVHALRDTLEIYHAIFSVLTGNPEQAVAHLEELLSFAVYEPKTAEQLDALACWVYQAAGRTDQALAHARRLPGLDGISSLSPSEMFLPLAMVWHMGIYKQILPEFLALADASGSNPGLLNNIAWILATTPGSPAPPDIPVLIARKALALQPDHPVIQDTLAATLAFAGRFDEAIAIDEDVAAFLRTSTATDAPSMLAKVENRLALYRQGKPHVENAAALLLYAR